jgi:hypothetical protein
MYPEPIFVNLSRSPAIYSSASILGFINVYKYGLWRAGTTTLFLLGS